MFKQKKSNLQMEVQMKWNIKEWILFFDNKKMCVNFCVVEEQAMFLIYVHKCDDDINLDN